MPECPDPLSNQGSVITGCPACAGHDNQMCGAIARTIIAIR